MRPISSIFALSRTAERLLRAALLLVTALLLSGCLIVSGEQRLIDRQGEALALQETFVGAEGSEQRSVEVGAADRDLQVIALLAVESGDFSVELLQPDGSVAFVLAARPDAQVTRSAAVRTDAAGLLHYRISAVGARNGTLQLFIQP